MASKWQVRVLVVLSLIFNTLAAVTLYVPEGQESLFGIKPSSTDTSSPSVYTGSAAYDPHTLIPPTPPTDPPVNTRFAVQLVNGDIPNLSIRHHGAFLGFSIELSVSNHICEFSLRSVGVECVRSYLIVYSGSQRVRYTTYRVCTSHVNYPNPDRHWLSPSSTSWLTSKSVVAESLSALVVIVRKPLSWFHPSQMAVLLKKTRAASTTRYDYHPPSFLPVLIVSIDANPSFGLYPRDPLYDVQHQFSCQR